MSLFNKQDRLNGRLGNRIYYNYSLADIGKCLELGADVNALYNNDYSEMSVLAWAAQRNREEVVALLLSHGADPNPKDGSGMSPLLRAVNHKNLDAVKALVAAGATVNAGDSDQKTPLLLAVRHGAGDLVKFLVENGADVNVRGRDGNTPLHLAAQQGFANLAKYLIENGADRNAANVNLNTAADVAEKEYPVLAAMIRGEAAPAVPPAEPADSVWKLVAADEIARVRSKEGIGYRITEIFNFSARTYTHIACNLESRAESQAVKSFSELDGGGLVDAAYDELVRLGGRADYIAPEKKRLAPPAAPPGS